MQVGADVADEVAEYGVAVPLRDAGLLGERPAGDDDLLVLLKVVQTGHLTWTESGQPPVTVRRSDSDAYNTHSLDSQRQMCVICICICIIIRTEGAMA